MCSYEIQSRLHPCYMQVIKINACILGQLETTQSIKTETKQKILEQPSSNFKMLLNYFNE